MESAKAPFEFVAASYLTRICPERAWTLGELAQNLTKVPVGSIFFHTFQSLESHHYTVFSSDFAQWVNAACNEAALAEQLAAIDLRDFLSVDDLRKVLDGTIEAHLQQNPQAANRPAFEPFYFCEAIEVVVPMNTCATTLEELAKGIERMSVQTLHFHFINSRLRLQLRTNDFSYWIENNLDIPVLAERLNRIDFYMNTLEDVRKEILQAINRWKQ